jgi:hypothetical protein
VNHCIESWTIAAAVENADAHEYWESGSWEFLRWEY